MSKVCPLEMSNDSSGTKCQNLIVLNFSNILLQFQKNVDFKKVPVIKNMKTL